VDARCVEKCSVAELIPPIQVSTWLVLSEEKTRQVPIHLALATRENSGDRKEVMISIASVLNHDFRPLPCGPMKRRRALVVCSGELHRVGRECEAGVPKQMKGGAKHTDAPCWIRNSTIS
jgi:hypothetical protein